MGENIKSKMIHRNKLILISAICFIAVVIIASTVTVMAKTGLIKKIVDTIHPIPISKIEILADNFQLERGEERILNATVFPENYVKGTVEWISSDTSVITVSDGRIVAVSQGKAVVYAVSDSIKSNEIEFTCVVSASGIAIESIPESIIIDDKFQLQAKVLPDDATDKSIVFQSSDSSVVSVDENGLLVATKLGTSEITVMSGNGVNPVVFALQVVKRPVNKITIDDSDIILGKGQSYIISGYVSPGDATYTDISWSSSDESVVQVEDGMILANGIGNAVVTASTDQGDKFVQCAVKVSDSNPKNEILYATGEYSIRRRPKTGKNAIAKTEELEPIEFLKDMGKGWFKVRNSKGVCGYIIKDSDSFIDSLPEPEPAPITRPVISVIATANNGVLIENVPYLNQFVLGYPTGCEGVSAVMVLNYYGFNVTCQDFMSKLPCGSGKYQDENGVWFAANPFKVFVGDPTHRKKTGSYGCFSEPIVSTMRLFASGSNVKNVSGCSKEQLFGYVKSGHPVIVWGTGNAVPLAKGVVWQFPDGSGSFDEVSNEHCFVLIGYDDDYVYLNDPSGGASVMQPLEGFLDNWTQLYSQAVIIE